MLRSVCLGIFLVGTLASSGPGTADTSQTQAFQEELAVELRSMGIDPEVIEFPGAISDEMKKWVHEKVPAGLSPEAALRRVLNM